MAELDRAELDEVAEELKAARRELHDVLLACAEWARWRASEDATAAHLADRVDNAMSRLTMANVLGRTIVHEAQQRE